MHEWLNAVMYQKIQAEKLKVVPERRLSTRNITIYDGIYSNLEAYEETRKSQNLTLEQIAQVQEFKYKKAYF
jgi:hypothetical protein